MAYHYDFQFALWQVLELDLLHSDGLPSAPVEGPVYRSGGSLPKTVAQLLENQRSQQEHQDTNVALQALDLLGGFLGGSIFAGPLRKLLPGAAVARRAVGPRGALFDERGFARHVAWP